jgi:hypothetical protein
MKLHSSMLRNSLLFSAVILLLGAPGAAGQATADTSTSFAQTSAVPARITQAIDETQLVRLRGNVHPLARPEFDQGAVADWQPMNRMLLLLQRSPEQEAALRKLMEEQQNRNSPNYHAWLTPEQFGKQFGPADADIQTVTGWLTSHGFQGIKVGAGRTAIEFSGTAGQVRNGFHTEIHHLMVNGEAQMANMRDPEIPAALAPVVAGVVSLHNFRRRPYSRVVGTFQRNRNTGEVKPVFTFTDVNGQFFAIGPADFATIYNVPSSVLTNPAGQGQTIAIVGRTNINIQDVRDFRSMFGLPAIDPVIVLNGPDPGIISTGEETEADLDVQWSGAVAPNATIKLVVTETPLSNASDGVDLSALYIVDNNLAPVMTESFGACEAALKSAGNQFYNALWEQAAAQGITAIVASGDSGSAGCDPAPPPATQNASTLGLAVSGTASTPFNIATGGTDFDNSLAGYPSPYWNTTNTSTSPPVLASAMSYIPEVPWNDSCAAAATSATVNTVCSKVKTDGSDLVAASGGPSSCSSQSSSGACSGGYAKPTWQVGRTPNDSVRDLPDVSLFAGDGSHKSFYIVCQSDQDITGNTGCNLSTFSTTSPFHDFLAVGGTSASAPTFAAIMALVNQQTGQRQGNANPVLYALAATSGNSCTSNPTTASNPGTCVFYDIAKNNNSVACQGGTPNCSNTNTAASAFGIVATTKGGTTPAFNAGAGYDLATGLGSVNVTNLLSHWANVTFTPSNTSIPVFPTGTIPHGSAANFTVDVTSTLGTPTGSVMLIASPPGFAQQALGPFPLATGVAPISTNLLPGSPLSGGVPESYPVVAHYSGDSTFGASDSTQVSVTVSQENSQTVVRLVTFSATGTPIFNSGPVTVAYGSPYIVRVDARNSSGAQCSPDAIVPPVPPTSPCPTGKVNLTDNGNPLNDFSGGTSGSTTLNGEGYLEDQPIQLPASSTAHSIVASYLGDNSFIASTSTPLAVTITPTTTTTTVVPSPSSIMSGGSVTLTATVNTTSNGDAPCDGTANTGTVQFFNGGTAITGTVMYKGISGAQSSNGIASCTATLATTIAGFPALPRVLPRAPNSPPLPWLVLAISLLLFFISLRWIPRSNRRAFTYASVAAFVLVSIGFAGCSNSGGRSLRTASITAKYSGDTNYAASTSSAATVTVQ